MSELYNCVHECNVLVNSFEDAINILKSYNNVLKLKSSCRLIDFFEKYKTVFVSDLGSKTNIQNLQLKLSKLENDNLQLTQSINDFKSISQLRESEDFEEIYNLLKKFSEIGYEEKMSLSLAVKLDEKQNDGEQTPLLHSCQMGDLHLTKSLIEGGCNRDVVSKYGNNCLVVASNFGHIDIVEYLIEIGFDMNWRNEADGFNAILVASEKGHLEIVKYLDSIGCDINSKTNTNANCIYLASLHGHLDTVKYLISCGVDPNEKDDNGFNAILVASYAGHLEVIKYLLMNGCNKNDKTNNNVTSLHWAAANGHLDVVEFLISIRVNLNEKNKDGKTALDLAREN